MRIADVTVIHSVVIRATGSMAIEIDASFNVESVTFVLAGFEPFELTLMIAIVESSLIAVQCIQNSRPSKIDGPTVHLIFQPDATVINV